MLRRSALRLLVTLAIFVAMGLLPASAFAWVELTVARDDIRLDVGRDGKARVEHRVLLLVSGGPLKSLSLRGVDADAAIEPGAYVIAEKDDKAGNIEVAEPVQITKKTADTGTPGVSRNDLDITLGDKGLGRGRYVLVVRYGTDLLATGALAREGATAALRWMGPSWEHGLDATRAVFSFPVAPTEPRADGSPIEPGDSADDPGFVSTVTRKGTIDQIELVRLYASRGERVLWAVRVDARALDGGPLEVSTAAPPPADGRPRATTAPTMGLEIWLPVGFALFVVVAGLVVIQGSEIRRRASDRGVAARPLVPLPILARACLASAALLGGAWLVYSARAMLGGALLSASFVAFVWHLPSKARHEARPPGKWLPVRLGEIFGRPPVAPAGVFHLDGRRGRVLVALVLALVAAGSYLASRRSLDIAVAVLCLGLPLCALFVTGGRRALPVDLAADPVPLLHAIALRVQRARSEVRLVPRIRLPEGRADSDEVRLAVLPPDPAAGLRAVEVAMGFAVGPGGYVLLPEILLRFEHGSPCAELARGLECSARRAPGRKLDERVLVFTPKLPTARLTAELVLALLERVSQPRAKQSSASPASATQDPRARKPARRVAPPETRTAA